MSLIAFPNKVRPEFEAWVSKQIGTPNWYVGPATLAPGKPISQSTLDDLRREYDAAFPSRI